DVAAYLTFFLVVALFYALVCLGLNLQWGFTGLFNAGVSGFVAVGAYGSGLLTAPPATDRAGGLGLPVALGWVGAALLAGPGALAAGAGPLRAAAGFPALRALGPRRAVPPGRADRGAPPGGAVRAPPPPAAGFRADRHPPPLQPRLPRRRPRRGGPGLRGARA